MKIRDLNKGQYVICHDVGKSEYSRGMAVTGKVIELEFDDDDKNKAVIESVGQQYTITDENYFDDWEQHMKDITVSVKQPYDENEIYRNIERRSVDLQQRKRQDKVNYPAHYNYGDIEVIDFIEQVAQHYNPKVAYHIGNAIKYLARSPHKNGKGDIAKAKWYIERAFEVWDVE